MPWEYVGHVLYVSLCASLLLLWGFLSYVPHTAFDRKEEEREGQNQFLRWGGFLVMIVFFGSLFWDERLVLTQDIWWMIGGIFGFLLLGVWDDIRHIPWKWQLLWQGTIVLFVLLGAEIAILDIPNIFGGRILLGQEWYFAGVLFALLWFLFLINALNWIDGIDGLAPGILIISCILLGALSLRVDVYQPPLAIMCFSLAGVFLGLYFFNIFPSHLMLGTAGVFAGGFTIAYFSVFAGAKVATAFLLFSLPLLDMVRVMYRRYILGKPLALPDTNHIHYVLRDVLNWKERYIAFFLVGCVLCIGVLSVNWGYTGKLIALFVVSVGFFLLLRREK